MGKASRKKEQQINGISSALIPASTYQSFLVRPLLALLIVLLLSFIVNFNVLNNGFGWDDDIIINNLRPPDHWWNLFLQNPTAEPAAREAPPYYRPIVSVSYLLDSMIWGRNLFGFHLSVLLAHLLNTALVLLLTQTLVRDQKPPYTFLPILVASLFAVHPAHAEAVAWIAGRNDVFCTTFVLFSILLYIRFRRTGKEWAFGLSMLFFFFALLTKEMAVGLVLLYPVYDYLFEPPTPSHARPTIRIRFLIPLAILGLYFWMRAHSNITQPLGSSVSGNASSPLPAVLGAAGLYLKLMIFPFPHNPFIATLPKSLFAFILSGLGLIFLVGGIVWSILRRHGLIGWGLAWTVALLAPAIPLAFLNVAATPSAERYVYAPSIGFLMAIGVLILNGLDRLRVRIGWTTRNVWVSAGFLWAVLVIALGWITWNRNAVWQNPLTFWEAAAAVSTGDDPPGAIAHNNLGHLYRRQKRLDKAMQEFQAALKLQPDYAMVHYNLGLVYKDLQRLENAVEAFQIAINLEPNYLAAHRDLAETYKDLGRLDEAFREYQMILQLKPDSAEAHVNLGMAYRKQGRLEDAVQEYLTALKFKPDSAGAHTNLGVIYEDLRQMEKAVQEYQMALKLQPDLVETHYNLGAIYKDHGRLEEAIREFQAALKLRPALVEAHYSLGDAYRRKGQMNEAIAAF
ncbi:MAG: tetratricopeptide repeat protein, partial [Nitrospirae bacterium]|nr:tetratricopeptide repeat protein [Nitrospirota bacterium]